MRKEQRYGIIILSHGKRREMMTFIKYKERKNTNCVKWDGLEGMYGKSDLLAMWVADMDFQVPECVTDALHEYVTGGVFGYYQIPDGYYQAFIDWEKEYHQYEVKKEWIRFSPGVVAAFYWIVQFMTKPHDAVLVNTPVYYPFMNAVKDGERTLVVSKLVCDNGEYRVDFEDFERKIVEEQVKLFILCFPHNPVGRVWKEEELRRMLEICRKHQVYVISDEIHHDLVFEGHVHIPTLKVGDYDDMVFMLTAPSKTFNLAGCQNSVIVIPNEELRKKWDAFVKVLRAESGNAFGYVAAEAAYKGGRPWFEEVKEMVYGNYCYVRERILEKLPKAVVSDLEGTYLAWVDLGAYLSAQEIRTFMEETCKLAFDYGDWFGDEAYASFIRINLATSRENITKAIEVIIKNILGSK